MQSKNMTLSQSTTSNKSSSHATTTATATPSKILPLHAPSNTTASSTNADLKPPLSREISKKIFNAFTLDRWYMMIFGKFPFTYKLKHDGTYAFEVAPYNYPQALWFYIITIMSVILCLILSFGILHAYFTTTLKEFRKDRCKQTWEKTIFTRHFDVVIFFLTFLFSSAFSGVNMWIHRNNIVRYMNYWSNMMQKIHYECTQGFRQRSVIRYVLGAGAIVIFISLYCIGKLVPMEETSGFFAQSCLLQLIPNLYAYGSEIMSVKSFTEQAEKCFDCLECDSVKDIKFCNQSSCKNVFNNPSWDYRVYRGFGFTFLVYFFLSAIATHILFVFFCRSLINTSQVWNTRFYIGISADRTEDMSNEFRRRLGLRTLVLDFGLVVELYQMTEEIFGLNLAVFYLMLMINIITQIYYMTLATSQKTCSEWVIANLNMDFLKYRDKTCQNWDEVMDVPNMEKLVSFEDPCRDYRGFRTQQMWFCVTLVVIVLYLFISTIWLGHKAVHEGLLGFQRLRKYNYMNTRDLSEKYFIHTVKLVYLGPGAIHISTANFFIVRRKLSIIIFGSAFVYLMMLVGFAPGQIRPSKTCRIDGKFVFKYPRITAYN